MGLSVNRITNANIYVNGSSFLGKAEEIAAPMVKSKMSEHKALGLVGTPEFFAGIEKMEAKIKWNSFYPEVMAALGDPTSNVSLQIRGSLQQYDSNGKNPVEAPVVIYLTAACKDFPLGTFKQHENVELESNLSIYYAKMEIGGVSQFEIDILANIYVVNGVDILAQYRANLGI